MLVGAAKAMHACMGGLPDTRQRCALGLPRFGSTKRTYQKECGNGDEGLAGTWVGGCDGCGVMRQEGQSGGVRIGREDGSRESSKPA